MVRTDNISKVAHAVTNCATYKICKKNGIENKFLDDIFYIFNVLDEDGEFMADLLHELHNKNVIDLITLQDLNYNYEIDPDF
jgi:hypothetical protein